MSKRVPKVHASSEVWGVGWAPLGSFFGFLLLKSLFLGFRVIQTGYWPDFNLESVLTIKNIFIMKNETNFRKNGETGVDLRLI